MPETIQYRPRLIEQLITNERLGKYKTVFKTTNDIELLGVYLWNIHVGSAIYPLTCAAEVTLRNSIDYVLTRRIGYFWWSQDKKGKKLKYKSFNPQTLSEPDSVRKLKENFQKAYDSRARTKPPIQKHYSFIAKTDFSTWEYILDNEFMGDVPKTGGGSEPLIWTAKHLKEVFTGTWPSLSAHTTLNYAKNLVSTIRKFRNRISHNEPVWKKFGVDTEVDAIKHLHEKIEKIEKLINLIDPEKFKLLEKSGFFKAAYRACSSEEIRRFQHLAQTHSINSIDDLKGLVTMQSNSTLKAQIGNEGITQYFLIVT